MSDLHRSTDPGPINEVINHPEVFKWVATEGQVPPLDVSAVIADPKNIHLMAEGGGFIFVELEPAIYEIHTNFLPTARGAYALRMLREALAWMFTHTVCMEVLTKVPVNNLAARGIARAAGASIDFRRDFAWKTAEGVEVQVVYYALRYHDWLKKEAGWLEKRGAWFHETLEAELARFGKAELAHDDDPAHDVAVGAAVEMILNGMVDKGIILYSRWAKFAGYEPISLISRVPTVIDIKTARLLVGDGTFEVIDGSEAENPAPHAAAGAV